MIINSETVAVGQTVSFSSEITNDSNVYTGVIVGVSLAYNVARGYGDLAAYHDQYVHDPPEEKPELDDPTMEYILVDITSTGEIMAFATIWITTSSFNVIDEGSNILFTVYNLAEANVPAVIQLLQDNNYSVKRTSAAS